VTEHIHKIIHDHIQIVVHEVQDIVYEILTRLTFVGAIYLALIALWAGWRAWRGADLAHDRWLLRAIALATPMGFVAVEAGWIVTELGRQPWVIYGVLKTADSVTPMPGLIVPFLTFTLLYCFLGAIVVWLLYRQILRSPEIPEWRGFYMPGGGSRERGDAA